MILITTYNRHDLLTDLLKQIESQGYDREVIILDDGTPAEIDFPQHDFQIYYLKFNNNHGKKNYYQVVSRGFQILKTRTFDYVWQLPDDVQLKPNFFNESKRIFDYIPNENKVCLSTGHDGQRHLKPCWTGYQPTVKGEYVQTQWNDLCYIANRKFFELLDWDVDKIPEERWSVEKDLGSGVGANISRRIHKMGYSMFHTMESLVEFKWVKSVMN